MSAPCLIVFARAPLPGLAKTRLAAGLGDAPAAGVYARLLYSLLASLDGLRGVDVVISAAGQVDAAYFAAAYPEYAVRAQPGGDMGQRLTDAFAQAFAAGGAPVVLVASDVAGLTANAVRAAFEALRQAPAVIGPTFDGGYYLLGLTARCDALFQDITWSTPAVLGQTAAAARRLGLAMPHLAPLADIDTLEDYQRWRNTRAGANSA